VSIDCEGLRVELTEREQRCCATSSQNCITMFAWDDLRHFLAVARSGSTIAASKVLAVSQSTVHRRLAELEKDLGRHLVVRTATGYRLTELGNELQPFVERVEEAVSAIERHLKAADEGVTGTINVTCSESIGYRLVRSTLLDTFHTNHPGLRVELLLSDRFLDLAKGEADIAIRAGEPDDDTLVGRKIADVPWALYASRSYIERHGGVSGQEDLNRHSVVQFDGGIKDHHAARWLRSVAPRGRAVAHSNTIPGLLMTVRSGVGVAPLPVPLAARDTELVRILGPLPGLFSPIYLLTHPDLRRSPRVSAFFEFVLSELHGVQSTLVDDGLTIQPAETSSQPT
jgi:DNA-binding transcriptional LysR family regulator